MDPICDFEIERLDHMNQNLGLPEPFTQALCFDWYSDKAGCFGMQNWRTVQLVPFRKLGVACFHSSKQFGCDGATSGCQDEV
eukprot:1148297-Pelagomonas_calceolata.AAC.3